MVAMRTTHPDDESDYWADVYATEERESGRHPPVTRIKPVDVLAIRKFSVLAAEVDARGPRRWLARGVWPAGDYGVHGAEPKAGKTWNTIDLAVSVASGTSWLGTIPIDSPGPVIVFAGEGGEGNLVRRVRAVAEARGLDADDLELHVCARAPHLNDRRHLDALTKRVQEIKPSLVTLDPLYLSAHGANGADLYAMGAMLEGPQHICQEAGAALFTVTHYNRSRDLKGAARLTGAGPAEWGRVLLSSAVISRHTDNDTRATTVLASMEVSGGEVPDLMLRIRRTIQADDPDDLDSPLRYQVDMPNNNDEGAPEMSSGSELAPATKKLLAAVLDSDEPASPKQLVDWVAEKYGHGLRRETVSRCLNELATKGLIDRVESGGGRGMEGLWTRPSRAVK